MTWHGWALLPVALGLLVGNGGCTRADVYAVTGTYTGDAGDAGDAADAGDTSDASPPNPCAFGALPPGDSSIKLQVGSLMRSYVLHVPPTYSGTQPAPLIVDLHGIGATGWGELSSSTFPSVTDPDSVIIAFPDGMAGPIGTGWNMGPCCVANVDDLGFIRAVVSNIRKTACIDPNRIYAVGVLTGGGMVNALGCQAADLFAAVAPSAFDLLAETVNDCKPSRPISVVSFRGTADTHVPYAGGASSLVPGMPITFLGAQATFDKWAQIDRCTSTRSPEDTNGCSSYSGCADGVDVILCTKQGGPAAPVDANVAWPVLKRHSLP